MPRTGWTFSTWPTTSYRTVKGKMPLFTAQRSLKFCVMLSCWSSESFVFYTKEYPRQWKCLELFIFLFVSWLSLLKYNKKRFCFWRISSISSSRFSLDGDQKVIKSVERILSIWEERGVYSGTLISELRSCLVKEESPVETPVEQKSKLLALSSLCAMRRIRHFHFCYLYALFCVLFNTDYITQIGLLIFLHVIFLKLQLSLMHIFGPRLWLSLW